MNRLPPLLFGCFLIIGGCQQATTDQQISALKLESSTLETRQLQSRRFETNNEKNILAACAGVLQDLGFNLDESSAKTGLLIASKNRNAVESGQVAGQLILAALVAAMGAQADPVWEQDQKIRISVVTTPIQKDSIIVRATFQRIIWNTKDQLSRIEPINDPTIYREFFDKLAQSVFLEAHDI